MSLRAGTVAVLVMSAAMIRAARAGADPSGLSVTLSPQVTRAPATVQLRVRLTPHAENRLLRMSLDSGAYFRSSEVPLEGSGAAATHTVRWPGIPSGTYTAVVELIRSNGDHRVVRAGRLEVVGF